jgi:hypothetical protein
VGTDLSRMVGADVDAVGRDVPAERDEAATFESLPLAFGAGVKYEGPSSTGSRASELSMSEPKHSFARAARTPARPSTSPYSAPQPSGSSKESGRIVQTGERRGARYTLGS